MPKAVRFEHYGDVDVLEVVDVPRPVPEDGQVVVRVKAAGMNPGEAAIRRGLLHERWPATFPSGQGSDLAGVVEELGPGVSGVAVGDEVIGFTHNRASQAELVAVDAGHLTPGPPVSHGRSPVRSSSPALPPTPRCAVSPHEGDMVVISGAAGGVGTIAGQLAHLAGATVIGLASPPTTAGWRTMASCRCPTATASRNASGTPPATPPPAPSSTPSAAATSTWRSTSASPPTASTRSPTPPPAQRHGTRTDGSMVGARAEVMAELAGLIESGRLDIPIASTYP